MKGYWQATQVSVFQALGNKTSKWILFLYPPTSVLNTAPQIVVEKSSISSRLGWAFHAHAHTLPAGPGAPSVAMPLPVPTILSNCEFMSTFCDWQTSTLQVFSSQRDTSRTLTRIEAFPAGIETPSQPLPYTIESSIFPHFLLWDWKEKESWVTNWSRTPQYQIYKDTHMFLKLVDSPKPCCVSVQSDWKMVITGRVPHSPRLTNLPCVLPVGLNIFIWYIKTDMVKEICQHSVWVYDGKIVHAYTTLWFGILHR